MDLLKFLKKRDVQKPQLDKILEDKVQYYLILINITTEFWALTHVLGPIYYKHFYILANLSQIY